MFEFDEVEPITVGDEICNEEDADGGSRLCGIGIVVLINCSIRVGIII